MATPTADDVHIPTAIGNNKKGKPTMGKKMGAMEPDADDAKGKKMGGKVPPQFLPKQKGKPAAGKKPAAKGKPFGKK